MQKERRIGFLPQRIAMTFHASQSEKPEIIASGRHISRMAPANGTRHSAEIRIGNAIFGLRGKLESDSKWWIMAMAWSLFIGGEGIVLAVIYLLKIL